MSRKLGCGAIAIVALLVALAWIFRSPELSVPARQALDDAVQATQGKDFQFAVLSTEKASPTIAGNVENIAYMPSGIHWPAGIYPPNHPLVSENWCAILDAPVALTSGEHATHFLLQKRESAWQVAGVPDSQALLFKYFGCSRW